MKIFFAYSFSQIIDNETGVVSVDHKRFLNNVRNFALEKNIEIFMAHIRENWGKDLMGDVECTVDDINEMKKCDIVLAFPGNPISGGVHVELGWASSMNKKIALFLKKDILYSPLVTGIKGITDVDIYYVDNDLDETFAIVSEYIKELLINVA